MADQDAAYTPVHVSARDIPPPSTISPAARQFLSDGAALPAMSWPAPDDKQAWRERIAQADRMWDEMAPPVIAKIAATIETVRIADVLCHECLPAEGAADGGSVYLFAHGGAFVIGAGAFARVLGARYAAAFGIRVVSVDYRMPPDHPFPAAPEDMVAVYQALLETVDPSRIVVGGGSAGGNIAAAATLMIRDRGLPMPAGVVLLTPEVDLTESGDSFRTNEDLDVILKHGLPECNALYADGHDLRDPYVSPLFADFARGFPPTLVQTGTRDLFLSNSVLVHRKLRAAGIDAELHVWEAMPHGAYGRGEAPEHEEITAEVGRFLRRVLG
ncbi:MAG: alpha/beta hydrolase [Sphingomonas sp.]